MTYSQSLENMLCASRSIRLSHSHALFVFQEMLLQDVPYWQTDDDLVPKWLTLTSADFSHNDIDAIDNSVVSYVHI